VPTIRSVSSVLSPVGPEPRTVYWLRRSILIIIAVAVVLLLAHACSGGSPSKRPAGHAAKPVVTPQPSTSSPAAATPRCTPAELSAKLSTDASTYPLGRDPKFTATIRNDSGTTCRLVSTVASRKWTVTSGPITTWTTAGCHLTGTTTRAKLTATKTVTVSISWDAHRNDSSCTVGSAALAGTYVLRATLDGVVGTPAIFHLTS
jgi:hypothetical protein